MHLPQELRVLVNRSVAVLGDVIRRELGENKFAAIEKLRVGMTEVRAASFDDGFAQLQEHFAELKKLKSRERLEVAHSFTLMLELMNACENAYRNHRLNARAPYHAGDGEVAHAIIYVLTAHPTEARSPENIAVFHEIQNLLTTILVRNERQAEAGELTPQEAAHLRHWIEVAWRTSVVRRRAPRVKDEADHIYSLLFRDDVLFGLLQKDDRRVPFFVRSWVGGDKDGHPGVNEKTLLESLTLSRAGLLRLIEAEFAKLRTTLHLFPSAALRQRVATAEKRLRGLRALRAGDAGHVLKFKAALGDVKKDYEKTVGAVHPALKRLSLLMRTFPAIVVPLELRESSDMLEAPANERPRLAIHKMLVAVEKISRGGDPRWYARGFIISMTQNFAHIQAAARFQKEVFGSCRLPIIPLFEEATSLAQSDEIVGEMVRSKEILQAARKNWDNMIEIMVGYSDSSKESGALASRYAIAQALPVLEKICEGAGLNPVFFHGSGGSIDRGGGSIEDQTAWWPKAALRTYKVTVQGEMVERSMASPAIAKRQLDTIAENLTKGLRREFRPLQNAVIARFAAVVATSYRDKITDPDFLKQVEAATPYAYLSALKIGSRPSKRSAQLTVKGLRAIPWILCWTQTRLLFPTWWGFGSAWQACTEKPAVRQAFRTDPVFTSYVKALGFTLAKVELVIWKMYLRESGLESTFAEFAKEFALAKQAYFEICEQKDFMWYRPWLGESIILRSVMIHPLNLLQILAQQSRDLHLLRTTVTGISSGMMTTG